VGSLVPYFPAMKAPFICAKKKKERERKK